LAILIVEDERLINLTVSEELRAKGFEVISAYDADSAIEILQDRDDIRLIFTDIDMPGSMNGLKLAAAVRNRWPPIHIIVTSGKHHPSQLPERSAFIAKPYRFEHVISMMQALL
jgi:DNA-binding NtrC family response regulator